MHTSVIKRRPLTEAGSAPPRERILAVARDLFYRQGIHAVGVDAIAEAAGTNKMTLYRHFESKDALIAACLEQLTSEFEAAWDETAAAHPDDPLAQLKSWMRHVAEFKTSRTDRGCAFVNAAVELPDKEHPARVVVDRYKTRHREKLVALCEKAGLAEPELLADKMVLLCEGARVVAQCTGLNGPAARLPKLLEDVISDHARKRR